MYQGVYHRKPYHPGNTLTTSNITLSAHMHTADLDAVLERSSEAGVEKVYRIVCSHF